MKIKAFAIAAMARTVLFNKFLKYCAASALAGCAGVAMAAAMPAPEVVFIESDVPEVATLLRGLEPNKQVLILDSGSNGLQQIAQWMSQHREVAALHLVAHGTPAQLHLGSLTLNARNLQAHADDLATIGRSLRPGAEILLYGCSVAQGAEGAAFVSELASRTHAVVAASTDITGAKDKGGNWTFEYATGRVTAKNAFSEAALAGYASTLLASTPPAIDLNAATPGTGNTVAWSGSGVVLADASATASDFENDASSWNGGSLGLQRVTAGGAADSSINDVFNFVSGGLFAVTGGPAAKGSDASGTLTSGAVPFAAWTYTSATGSLSVNFNANATTALVQDVVRRITYTNATPYGDTRIRFSLNDGGGSTTTADALVTSSTIYVDQTAYDATGIAANGFNLAEALAIAKDGDTVRIADGTYRGQFTATTAVTIDGVNGAAAQVTLEAPDNAALVPASPNSIPGRVRYPILNLQTGVAGSGTITVRNLAFDGRYQGRSASQENPVGSCTYDHMLIGIATYDSNAMIDSVNVQHIAAPLDGSGNYEGCTRHHAILAEGSSALGSPVTVTIKNSTIGTFQKTGILAWGPKLHVVISDNHISGTGILGRSVQNGMQIASAGARAGTTATINGNTIDNLGAPADLVAGGLVATGFYPVSAGAIEAYNNTVSVSPSASSNSLIGSVISYQSAAANLHDNTFNGMSPAMQVDSALVTAVHQFANNALTTAGDLVVFFYDPAGNGDTGGETIANFSKRNAIQVKGENFSSGTVTNGTGAGVAPNSVQVHYDSVSGKTDLYIDATVAGGPVSPLHLTLNGRYEPKNFVLSGAYLRYLGYYNVTYDANGGSNAPTDASSPYPDGGTVTALGQGGMSRTGYAFAGWNTQAGGGGVNYSAGGTFTIDADTTLYAKWAAVPYTVTYYGNGNTSGTAPVDSGTYTIGQSATVLGNPGALLRNGYVFAGWNTAADGSGTNYVAGSSLAIGAANINLYARWVVISFVGASASGSGTIAAGFVQNGTCSLVLAQFIPLTGHPSSPPAGSAPPLLTFPHGLFDFSISGCTPGATVQLTVTYPQALPSGTQYWKYGPTPDAGSPHWYVLPNAVVSGNTISFAITDGGKGDDDYISGPNGTIIDQGGPGVTAPVQIPSLSEWGRGLLAILIVLAALAYRRKRPQKYY